VPLLDGRHDRLDRRALEAADALERVDDLALLLLKLALIRQDLPRRAGVRRTRLDPVRRRLEQLGHASLTVAPLALDDPGPDTVTWNRAVHEHDVAAGPGDPATAVRKRLDHEVELLANRGTGGCFSLRQATYAGKAWT
jgi:hypothetical protein